MDCHWFPSHICTVPTSKPHCNMGIQVLKYDCSQTFTLHYQQGNTQNSSSNETPEPGVETRYTSTSETSNSTRYQGSSYKTHKQAPLNQNNHKHNKAPKSAATWQSGAQNTQTWWGQTLTRSLSHKHKNHEWHPNMGHRKGSSKYHKTANTTKGKCEKHFAWEGPKTKGRSKMPLAWANHSKFPKTKGRCKKHLALQGPTARGKIYPGGPGKKPGAKMPRQAQGQNAMVKGQGLGKEQKSKLKPAQHLAKF